MATNATYFTVPFALNTSHRCSVLVHKSRAAMRAWLTRKKGHNSSNTEASCWQCSEFPEDNVICELHFYRDGLSLDTVAHECAHAAHHSAIVAGVPLADDDFQEWTAARTGRLLQVVLLELQAKGLKVRNRDWRK